ncbi:hypothetical protein E2C01_021278 [Portunus trituberculatus]|uniref:Uncharacterized protein n=1 Tax=Portunus trituberculatus TaxID=210409 RepID=A0A5B7E5N3_PORTR|nr:hypothetical protein [Portunus trituberculatus]
MATLRNSTFLLAQQLRAWSGESKEHQTLMETGCGSRDALYRGGVMRVDTANVGGRVRSAAPPDRSAAKAGRGSREAKKPHAAVTRPSLRQQINVVTTLHSPWTELWKPLSQGQLVTRTSRKFHLYVNQTLGLGFPTVGVCRGCASKFRR